MLDIIEAGSIEASYKDCIIKTNSVLKRWIGINGVNPKVISSDDARTILLGYIKKFIFRGDWIDFRRLSKSVMVHIDQTTCLITHVIYTKCDSEMYFRNRERAKELYRCMDEVDYRSLHEKTVVTSIHDEDVSLKGVLSFKSIEDITF
jgi:hypothetical protein